MQHYVLGFIFNTTRTNVALIRKNRPAWQAGFLNGIGGKVEKQESPLAAMARECQEECGLLISQNEWRHFGLMQGIDFKVWCFSCEVASFEEIKSLTDEDVEVINLTSSWQAHALDNVPSLVNLALNKDLPFVTLDYRETAKAQQKAYDASKIWSW